MVNITIDEKKYEVPAGITVLQATREVGIEIPTLCDHPKLSPYGGCRLCLVEVEGYRTLQPACTLPVTPNMVVRTATDKIKAARKFVLTLIFSERNHFCPFCQVSGGDCELQNAAYGEGMTHWPLQPNWQPYQVDASHKYFVLDNNRCILCRRCVRACGEMVGNFTLGFEERGAASILVADLGTPLGESSCISCGTCVQICPTGALIDRQSAYHGRETQVDRVKTVCVGCSVGCGAEVLTRDNNLVRIEGNWDAPVTDGLLCVSGRFEPIDPAPARVAIPMVRKDGALKAATWDEALDVIASHVKTGGVAATASTRLPAEALFAFKQIFADHLASDVVTSIEEGAFTNLASKVADETGKSFEGTLAELSKSDCMLTLGVDLVKDHQVAGFFVKRSVPKGAKLLVVDVEENGLDYLADEAMKPARGTELDLIVALTAAIAGDPNKKLAGLAEKAKVAVETIQNAAALLKHAQTPVFVAGSGLTSKDALATFKALVELAKVVNATIITPKGQANSFVAAQYGLDKAFTVAGKQSAVVALGDEIASQKLLKKLEGVGFLAVMASYKSQVTAAADVVLPVTTWVEQEGHYVSFDGRIQEAKKAIQAGEEIWSTEAVLVKLAEKLGVELGSDWKAELKKRTLIAELV